MTQVNNEILAAITAALTSFNTKPGYSLVVKSFRRLPQVSPIWSTSGRLEMLKNKGSIN